MLLAVAHFYNSCGARAILHLLFVHFRMKIVKNISFLSVRSMSVIVNDILN